MHEIEETSAFFTRKPAWHGIGTVFQDAPGIEEALKASGADYEVLSRPIYRAVPVIGESGPTFNYEIIPERVELYRDRDGKGLGIVSPRYRVLQNRDAFRWFEPAVEAGDVELEAGGVLREGRRIWVLAKVANAEANVAANGDDPVRGYLLLTNSHDGSMMATILFTPVRVVCMNTLTLALREGGGQALQIRHRSSMDGALEVAQKAINCAKMQFDISIEEFRAMQRKPITERQFKNDFYLKVFPSKDWEKVDEGEAIKVPNTYEELLKLFENGAGARTHRGTAWGALNAVTEWVDHIRAKEHNRGERALTSGWFGPGSDLKNRARKVALSLLD